MQLSIRIFQCNVDEWSDIVAIGAGYLHAIGLQSNGTIVAIGSNRHSQYNVSE